jgi:lipopolysaccharide biosynthesis protein
VPNSPPSRWPADFDAWVLRGGGRLAGSFPDSWRERDDMPIPAPSRVAVVVHAYHLDLLDELCEQIARIPVAYDLLITSATDRPIDIGGDMGSMRNLRVFDVENRGRDILPLVGLVNAGYLDPYDMVLKVHTKRSSWRGGHRSLPGDGETWRHDLIQALLGTTDNVAAILSAFADQPDLGLVTADGSVCGSEEWGDNEGHTAELLRRVELSLDPDQLRFAAGSMYWARGFVVQGLRALGLGADDFEPESGQVNLTTAHAVERALGVVASESGLSLVGRSALPAAPTDSWRRFAPDAEPPAPRARVVPFYLPQFHPIAENDRWWGEGFTDWRNVAAARPVFRGHHQPLLPRDLGFYDLRLDDVRQAQADIAADAGVAGFMYYYYWFSGKRLLDTPIERLRKSDIRQPFCLMWANENWTRRWDGRSNDVLIAQNGGRVPADDFIDDVLPLLADERYMTIDGRKIVAIYRPGLVPNLRDVVAEWRRRARTAGVGDLFVLNVDVHREFDGLKGTIDDHGLDGSIGFPPHNHLFKWVRQKGYGVDSRFRGNLLSYGALVTAAERRLRSRSDPARFPGVMVAFDNTPRRQWGSDIWLGSNPFTFRRWLSGAVRAVRDRPPDERMVFVNAWNEWAEGAVLEPTDRFGRTFLLAVRDVTLG